MRIGNAFSLNMVEGNNFEMSVVGISLEMVRAYRKLESVVGHKETANILSEMIGIEIPFNRATVKLQKGEMMIIAQYIGPRLSEGAVSLPEGARIEFRLIEIL